MHCMLHVKFTHTLQQGLRSSVNMRFMPFVHHGRATQVAGVKNPFAATTYVLSTHHGILGLDVDAFIALPGACSTNR